MAIEWDDEIDTSILDKNKIVWDEEEAAQKEKEPEKGFIERSKDALQLGLSDAMSTIAGDTYGRSGDPVAKDSLNPVSRLVKAAGGDILPAVGDVSGDAIVSAGKEVLNDEQEALVGEKIGQGMQYISESAPGQAISGGLEKWKSASPESYALAGELGNIALAAAPVKGLKPKFGERAMAKVADAEKVARQKGVLSLAVPDDLSGAKPVMRKGLSKKVEAEPGPRLKAQIETTEAVPGVNAKKTYTENVAALDKELSKVDSTLLEKLDDAPDIDPINVDLAIDTAMNKIADTPALRGAPAGLADSISVELQRLLAEVIDPNTGMIAPKDLLKVRRNLDKWVTDFAPGVFEEGSSALKIANKEIRNTLNNVVAASAPNAGVASDLKKMNQLLDSKTTMLPRAKKEVGTGRFKRYLDAVERETGFAHPKTPASIAANTGIIPASFAGGVALARQGMKAGKGGVRRNVGATQKLMADALRGGSQNVQRGALLGAFNQDEDEVQVPLRR